MNEKRKIQRFNLDEGRIWEAIEGLSPFKTTYTLEEVCEKLNELAEENGQLRGINKEIGDDLYNCRLNKDIVSEKLKLWQDTLAEYDIYTIKDFKELMKNDN